MLPVSNFERLVAPNILLIREKIGEMTGLGDYVGIKIVDASAVLANDPLSKVDYFPRRRWS